MLVDILSMTQPVLEAPTAEAATQAFHDALEDSAASYLQTRSYRRPGGRLTSERHWNAGGFVARYTRPDWPGSTGFNYICFDCNPLLEPIREGLTRYRFGDFAIHDDRRFGDYWDALSAADIAEAVCATAYGSGGRITSVHLGFPCRESAAVEGPALQFASQILVERMMELSTPPDETSPRLTARERDCLAFVADGKSDRETAEILGLSEATIHFHVNNARRKLGAVTRAQAVARLALARML